MYLHNVCCIYLFIYLFICLFVCLFVYLFVYLFVCLFVYLFVCLFVCLVIETPVISPILQSPVNPLLSELLVFNCTVNGRPLVNITWDVDSTPILSISQYPVDFNGPAVSNIQINSSLLSGTVPIRCYGNETVNATAVINAFSKFLSSVNVISALPLSSKVRFL